RAHRGRDARVVAVQYDDVPGAEIVAVVSPGRIVGGGSEVAEVSDGGGARVVVVVAERGVGAGLVAPPGGGVTIRIVRRRPARVFQQHRLEFFQQTQGVTTVRRRSFGEQLGAAAPGRLGKPNRFHVALAISLAPSELE